MAPSSGGHATFAYFMKDLTKKLLQLKNESQGRLPAQLCTGSWGLSVWGDQGLVARSMGEEWAKTTFEDHIAYLRRREDFGLFRLEAKSAARCLPLVRRRHTLVARRAALWHPGA